MKAIRSCSVAGLIFLGMSWAAWPAQAGQEPPRIRAAQAFTVVVDTLVTDKRNRVLSDLTSEDFRLYEDGVLQRIDSVRFIQPAPAAPRPAAAFPNASPQVEAASPVQSRPNLIIFLLDYATTEFTNQKLVRDAAQRYIQESLRPNDYVAIFSLASGFRFLQDFTQDRTRLLSALGSGDISGEALSAAAGAPLPPGAQRGQAEPISVTGGSPGQIAASAQAAAAQGSGQADLMLAERIQQLYYTMTSFVSKREAFAVLGAIQAISQVVSEIEGRKTLVLFSQGFVVGPHMEPELDKTVSLANKANVAIYGVDSQGLSTRELSGDLIPQSELASISSNLGRNRIRATGGESLFDRARQVGSDVRDSALRYISTATGGFAIRNTNNLFDSLQRVDQDARAYYLITYRPSNLDFDGEFRQIRVEVDRPGTQVRSRAGYIAVPPGMETLSGEEFQLVRDVHAGKIGLDLPVFLRLDPFREGEQSEVLVTLELAGRDLQFGPHPQDKALKLAELSIVGLVRGIDGQVLERFGAPVNLNVTPEEAEALQGAHVRFSNSMPLEPGIYAVEALVRDGLSGRTGRAEQSLRLEPLSPDLSLSGIVLGRDVEAVSGPDGRLRVGGVQVMPSAQRQFATSDRLVYYFEIYPADESRKNRYQVEVAVVRSGSRREMALPSYPVSGRGSLATARFLQLSSLTRGSYILRVKVVGEGGQTAQAQTSFQIVP